MTRALDPEEVAALAVLDSLGRFDSPDETSVPDPEDEIEDVLRRLYREAIAFLAYSLEVEKPAPQLKAELMSQTVGESTQEVEPIGQSAAPTSERPFHRPTESLGRLIESEPRAELGERLAAASGRSRRPWMALAAVLALALVGVGFWGTFLLSELAAERARLAWTEKEWKGTADATRAELRALEERFALVTSPAATVFPLRCPTGHGPAATARGTLYLAPDQKSWELEIFGLAPEPAGRDYQVWFMVGELPRSAGCFNVRDGKAIFPKQGAAPPGTTSVAVTLEPKGGSIRPTSQVLLTAPSPVRL